MHPSEHSQSQGSVGELANRTTGLCAEAGTRRAVLSPARILPNGIVPSLLRIEIRSVSVPDNMGSRRLHALFAAPQDAGAWPKLCCEQRAGSEQIRGHRQRRSAAGTGEGRRDTTSWCQRTLCNEDWNSLIPLAAEPAPRLYRETQPFRLRTPFLKPPSPPHEPVFVSKRSNIGWAVWRCFHFLWSSPQPAVTTLTLQPGGSGPLTLGIRGAGFIQTSSVLFRGVHIQSRSATVAICDNYQKLRDHNF